MHYPDFSFYQGTRLVLFFLVCGVTTATYYWGTNLLPYPNPEKVSFQRKMVFSLLVAMLCNVLPTYGGAYIDALMSHVAQGKGYLPRMVMGPIFNMMRIINPLYYFVLFYFGVKILLLPIYRSAKTMQLAYVYFVCCHILIKMSSILLSTSTIDPRGWNYLRDMYMQLLAMGFIYCFYFFVKLFYKKSQFRFGDPLNGVITDVKKSVLVNFIICCAIFIVVFFILEDPKMSVQQCVLLFSVLFSYLIVAVFLDYHQLQKKNMRNQEEYITILKESIADFRGIKHDFNNILQTYSGYLTLKDYEKLAQYHEKVTQTMEESGRTLDLNQRLLENPPFFVMLNKKIELGQQKGIQFQIDLRCHMGNVFMEPFHFIQVFQLICDLTTQFAMRTLIKRLSISGQTKADGEKLFIFTNRSDQAFLDMETSADEKCNAILEETTFKRSLHQINEILVEYANTAFYVYSDGDFLTIYLEVTPSSA